MLDISVINNLERIVQSSVARMFKEHPKLRSMLAQYSLPIYDNIDTSINCSIDKGLVYIILHLSEGEVDVSIPISLEDIGTEELEIFIANILHNASCKVLCDHLASKLTRGMQTYFSLGDKDHYHKLFVFLTSTIESLDDLLRNDDLPF